VFEIILKKPRAEDILQKKSSFADHQAKKRRGGERDFHVFGEDAGDVLIVTIPGYHLDFNAGTGTSVGSFFQPSTFFGQHGYPQRPEMKAIFYGAGPSFKSKTVKEVNNVDVAPTVAELMASSRRRMRRKKRSIRRPSDFILPSFTRVVTCS
jgi:hypothetical protein